MERSLSERADTVALMPKTLDPVDVLKRVMDDHNVNQSELALEAGISNVTVNRWLNRRTELTEKKLLSVLRTIGVAPEAYGLAVRKLPRAGTTELLAVVLEEIAASDERARARHEAVMVELRLIRDHLGII